MFLSKKKIKLKIRIYFKSLDKINLSNFTNIKQLLCNHFEQEIETYKNQEKLENYEFESNSIVIKQTQIQYYIKFEIISLFCKNIYVVYQ